MELSIRYMPWGPNNKKNGVVYVGFREPTLLQTDTIKQKIYKL